MATAYSSTFPAQPPQDYDDPSSVAQHDQHEFDRVGTLLRHWDRPHRRSFHWMITLDHQDSVIALSQQCQQLLPQAGLDLVMPDSLHLTVRRLGYVDEVADTQVSTAVRIVGEHCRATAPIRLQVIPLAGSPGAVRFSVAPWSPLCALFRTVSMASGYGDDFADPLVLYRPHIGIAYSSRVQASDPYVTAVREARSLPPAAIEINQLCLVELHRKEHQYQWRVLERLPLASATPLVDTTMT